MVMTRLLIILFILLLPVYSFPQAKVLVIKNVAVIDLLNYQVLPGKTVVIEGNKIIAVSKKVTISKPAKVIDGSGKYLIPGFWDMHVHVLTDSRFTWVFPLLIANGITGVREMGNHISLQQADEIRKQILTGKLTGPRIGTLTGRILDGSGTRLNVSVAIGSADSGRQMVRFYKQQGANFIKVYDLLNRETFLAIADESKKQK